MQQTPLTKDLVTHEIVAWGNALGQSKGIPALLVVELVNSPGTALVLSFLLDLEPLQAVRVGSGSIVDLGEIGDNGTVVRGSNRIVFVVGELSTANNVAPEGTDLRTSLDFDDLVGDGLREALVAGHLGCVYILDGVVGCRDADTDERALVNAVHIDLLEDGVGRRGGGERQQSELREHDGQGLS